MSAEFVDTNVLVYAHDSMAGTKQESAARLLAHLSAEQNGALSVQVLAEFYSAATRKLQIKPETAAEAIGDFATWRIHSLSLSDLVKAAHLHRRHQISWWDALLIISAQQLGCSILWTEDFSDGQRFGSLTIRNPFRES